MRIKDMILYIKEVRDNTPAIYEAEDREYYAMLTEVIDSLPEYDR